MRLVSRLIAAVLLCAAAGPVVAQETALRALEMAIVLRPDAWGQEQAYIEGRLHNDGPLAWTVEQLVAEVSDAEETLIGEGFGFLTGVCGEALPLDHALQPGESAPFALQLDLFGAPEVPPDARIEILPQASSREPALEADVPAQPGITQIDGREIVELEWVDAQRLRYSSGCWRDVFTMRAWHEVNLLSGERSELAAHPDAEDVTPDLLKAIDQTDPLAFRRSFFSFAPGQRRALYQNALNSLVTVEPNGSFQRVLFGKLYNITLQGVIWQGTSGIFIAWFHAGPGKEVRYAVGNAEGRPISQHPSRAFSSNTVPGVSASGLGVVINATLNGVTGYFLKDTASDFTLPMFTAESPGNHWPAPWYAHSPGGRRIYIARPVDGMARLQCYNPDTKILQDLVALPFLQLTPDARSRMALSPDFSTLALAANGIHGGLWLIDLQRFAFCI